MRRRDFLVVRSLICPSNCATLHRNGTDNLGRLVRVYNYTSSRITSRRLTQVPMSQFILRRHIKVLALGGLVFSGIVFFMQVGGLTDTNPQPAQITESALDVVQCLEPRPQIVLKNTCLSAPV